MTQDGFKRKLAAILSADVEGYSRLMDQNEEATVRTLTTYRNAISDLVQQYRGRVVDTPGDNVLAEFNSVVDAVNCAIEIQRDLAERNAKLSDNRKMEFRIGINLGDIIEEKGRIYGDGVNIAARIESKEAPVSEAYRLAKRAIGLDERNEYAHWSLGFIQLWRRKHDLAVAELKRAIELNPNCSLAFGTLGTVLSYSGEPDESIKNNEIAIRLNPRDISIFFRYSGLAMAHFVADRFSEAVQWARKCIHRKPIWRVGHAVLVSSLAQLDLLEEAKAAVDNFLENIPNETISKLRKLPFKNRDDAHRFEEGLRKAGLPE